MPVGDRGLLHRLRVLVERGGAVDGIDQRDHAVEPEAHHQIGMRHRGLQHRRRIGEAGGLDDHALERGAAVVEIAQQLFQRGRPDRRAGAAQAAARQHHMSPSIFSTSRWSSPISPNSLMMTAVSASAGSRSSRLSSVVLPAPRKPVSSVSGIGAGGRLRRGLIDRRSPCGGLRRLAGCSAGGLAVASALAGAPLGVGFLLRGLLGRRHWPCRRAGRASVLPAWRRPVRCTLSRLTAWRAGCRHCRRCG